MASIVFNDSRLKNLNLVIKVIDSVEFVDKLYKEYSSGLSGFTAHTDRPVA